MSVDRDLFDALLRESEDSHAIDLDHFAERVAPYNLDAAAIDELIDALESKGRKVEVVESYDLRGDLAIVLPAARAFAATHGRRPTVQELADAIATDVRTVRRALMFGQIMGR